MSRCHFLRQERMPCLCSCLTKLDLTYMYMIQVLLYGQCLVTEYSWTAWLPDNKDKNNGCIEEFEEAEQELLLGSPVSTCAYGVSDRQHDVFCVSHTVGSPLDLRDKLVDFLPIPSHCRVVQTVNTRWN